MPARGSLLEVLVLMIRQIFTYFVEDIGIAMER